jgi:hypothetical protein
MFFNIGMCHQLVKNYPDAIAAYLKSTAADNRFAKSWMNLG